MHRTATPASSNLGTSRPPMYPVTPVTRTFRVPGSALNVWRSSFTVHRSPFTVVYNKNHENTYIYKTKKTETMPESLRPMNGELRTLTAPPNVVASRSGHGYFAGTYGS